MTDSSNIHQDFLTMVENHKKMIYKIANMYCSDAEDREDLVQEIILALWKAFPKYNAQFAMSTWIYRIGLNISISFYRKAVRRSANREAREAFIEWSEPDHQNNHMAEQVERLHYLIGQLSPLDKGLMLLYLEERKHSEIAEILGISASNVATKINRIKQKLNQQFNKTSRQ